MNSHVRSVKWLLLLYQIPTNSETERVRIWRSLQKIGSVSVKNSVAAVPHTSFFKEAILELATDITLFGGEAIVTEGDFIFGLDESSLLQTYSAQLDAEYKNLSNEIRIATSQIKRNLPPSELMKWEHKKTRFQSKLNELTSRSISLIDGKDLCKNSLAALEKKLSGRSEKAKKKAFARPPLGSIWVTRKDPMVDRLASAWLIKRFIDPKAEIRFVDMDTYSWEKNHVRFDVFNSEFGHVGEKCTFEVLIDRFKIKKPAIRALGEIVHDLDIQDQKYDRRETEGIRMAIDGVIRSFRKDDERLQNAMVLLDSLTVSLK